jgi:hypothetical protein
MADAVVESPSGILELKVIKENTSYSSKLTESPSSISANVRKKELVRYIS